MLIVKQMPAEQGFQETKLKKILASIIVANVAIRVLWTEVRINATPSADDDGMLNNSKETHIGQVDNCSNNCHPTDPLSTVVIVTDSLFVHQVGILKTQIRIILITIIVTIIIIIIKQGC